MAATLYLIRHAEARASAAIANTDWPLSDAGAEQAAAFAPVLMELGITACYCSPARRCVDTLHPFLQRSAAMCRIDEGLRERDFGVTWTKHYRALWNRCWENLSYTPPRGEHSSACRKRIQASLEDIGRRHRSECVAVVSHGNSIGLFLTEIPPFFGRANALAMRTPDLFKVVYDGRSFRWDPDFDAGAGFAAVARSSRG